VEKLSYLKSINADYIEELAERYAQDPDSIDVTWRYFFEGVECGEQWESDASPLVRVTGNGHSNGNSTNGIVSNIDYSSEAKVANLIQAYREMGTLLAKVDPLSEPPAEHPLLSFAHFGLSEVDPKRTFTAGRLIGLEAATLSEIVARLREIYCGSIGVEFTHIQDPESRNWIRERLESSRSREMLSADDKKHILARLTDAESFEKYLHRFYVGKKRFSIEGGESLVPLLDRIVEESALSGAHRLVMGMAHRGRLNVLANIFAKPVESIFAEFDDVIDESHPVGMGDVKYHMGYSSDVTTRQGKSAHLTLAHNPSHLEFVNPIVGGVTRSKQRKFADKERTQVIPVLLHGDAAFAGQGVVYESLNMSQLSGYRVGGTIHVVINNQVGFTADPESCRSTRYSTDMAKMLETPIFHVNGDDPEAVFFVAKLCIEYRQRFKKDIFIDLMCFRKFGHNEADEPRYTQPLTYQKIDRHPGVRALYAARLEAQGVCAKADADALVEKTMAKLTEAQAIARSGKSRPAISSFDRNWKHIHAASSAEVHVIPETAVSLSTLKELGERLYAVPNGFKPNDKLFRTSFQPSLKSIQEGVGVNWGTAEALAFGTLIQDGHVVRLTGQDAERGTFGHRHCVWHDTETGKKYTPLTTLKGDGTGFVVRNSHLSETAVLGFEYGWSLDDPDALVLWEAQFGDFANGAQVIIDQFIAASEAKWSRSSGIVLLLPHGYEGQGPEHSSARVERFLQLAGDNNMAVANCTTPAQLFHLLRGQLKRPFRKPLVLMTPKSLLRHPGCVSKLEDLTKGTFHPVLDDVEVKDPKSVNLVLMCSGKIYFELEEQRRKSGNTTTAIVRLEKLYPWPEAKLQEVLNRYPNARLRWVQEEPRNMGAWNFVFSHWAGGYSLFSDLVGKRSLDYVGRDIAASPAVGSENVHKVVQRKILETAFKV
jgi:2-oxoglutarate dehydrogenase E1 component